MKRMSYLVVIAGLVVAAYGCKKADEAAGAAATAAGEATEAVAGAAEKTGEAAAGAAEKAGEAAAGAAEKVKEAVAGGDIGVPECDEYVTKYEGCLKAKVPEASRGPMMDAFAKTRESWKKMAENEATKAGLAQACKQALEAAKTSMKAMGCEF